MINQKRHYQKYLILTLIVAIVSFSLVACQAADADLPMLSLASNLPPRSTYFVYDIADIVNGNPWHEGIALDKLPVFKNKVLRNGAGEPLSGLSVEQMTAKLNYVAKFFGQTVGDITQFPSKLEIETEIAKGDQSDRAKQPYELSIQLEDVNVLVQTTGVNIIQFRNPVALPPDLDFSKDNQSAEEGQKTVDYLMVEYAGLFGFDDYNTVLSGSYNFDGKYMRRYGAYRADADIVQEMLNFAYDRVNFSSNPEGTGLVIIGHHQLDLSEKIGDYPIIDVAQAKQLLFKDKHLVHDELPELNESRIGKVELVYGYSPWDVYHMPYYRFYVQVEEPLADDTWPEGLLAYSVYYVPAIEGRYIENMAETFSE